MLKLVGIACAVTVVILGALAFLDPPRHVVFVSGSPATPQGQVMYVRNLATRYISDTEIRRDIPAWEHAVNVDVAKYWSTTRYRLVFIGRKQAPAGAEVMTFVNKGPVRGALAFHNVENGAPSITVYAGTGVYYGYDNSVSATHELEELAADPVISNVMQGWPYDYYWLEHPNGGIEEKPQYGVYGWFGEVSDPVESDFYLWHGVKISDFVTPAWFNSGGGSRFDFMGLCQQPFWVRPGGYAQYMDFNGWQLVSNWRHGVASDRGFFLAEKGERA